MLTLLIPANSGGRSNDLYASLAAFQLSAITEEAIMTQLVQCMDELVSVCGNGRNSFVRVQYTTWIEQLFHLPHEFNRWRSSTVLDVFALAESNAVFCADAAATLRHVLIEERLNQSHNLATVVWTCCVEVKIA